MRADYISFFNYLIQKKRSKQNVSHSDLSPAWNNVMHLLKRNTNVKNFMEKFSVINFGDAVYRIHEKKAQNC